MKKNILALALVVLLSSSGIAIADEVPLTASLNQVQAELRTFNRESKTLQSVTDENTSNEQQIEKTGEMNDRPDLSAAKKTEFLQLRQKALELRQQLQTRLAEAKKKQFEARQRALLKIAETQIKHLENLKNKVEALENLTDQEKTDLKNSIDQGIAKINTLKGKIESATTDEQLKNLGRELLQNFHKWQDFVKKAIKEKINHRMDNAVANASRRAEKIGERLTQLKANGLDTSKQEQLLADAQKLITEVKSLADEGKIKEAAGKLKEVYKKFTEIARMTNSSAMSGSPKPATPTSTASTTAD